MTLNVAVDIRTALGPVRDQGRRPTCLAFATSDAHRYVQQHGAMLCVEWLYYHAIKLAGAGPRDGTTILNTRTVLNSMGQPEECDWPYSSNYPDEVLWQPPNPSTKILTSGSINCSGALDFVRTQLNNKVPIVMCAYLSSTFRDRRSWTTIGDEVLLAPNIGEPIDISDGHAMVAVGYATFKGEALILLRNSWGSSWGSNGHAWVREDFLTQRQAGAFIISKGVINVL